MPRKAPGHLGERVGGRAVVGAVDVGVHQHRAAEADRREHPAVGRKPGVGGRRVGPPRGVGVDARGREDVGVGVAGAGRDRGARARRVAAGRQGLARSDPSAVALPCVAGGRLASARPRGRSCAGRNLRRSRCCSRARVIAPRCGSGCARAIPTPSTSAIARSAARPRAAAATRSISAASMRASRSRGASTCGSIARSSATRPAPWSGRARPSAISAGCAARTCGSGTRAGRSWSTRSPRRSTRPYRCRPSAPI